MIKPTLSCIAIVALAFSGLAAADEPAPKWHEVKPGKLSVQLTVDGVFEAVKTHEVKVELDQWPALKVAEPIEQGRHVSKGDVLIRFDTEDIDKKILETEKARQQAAIALADAEADLAASEVTVPLDLAAAERAYVVAKEKHERWTKHNRAQYITNMENTYESAKFALAYQQAELDQLRKMYAEDSITEESEEIVLERQERSVKLAKDKLVDAETDYDWSRNINLPHLDAKVAAEWKTAQATWKKVQQTLPRSLESKRLAVDKMRRDREESDKNFAELKADREKLVVKSPATGIVYYGSVNRGKWEHAAVVDAAMKPDGTFKPGATILTVVQPRPLQLRTGVNEAQLRKAVAGSPVRIVPAADPNLQLTGKVEAVAPLPIGTTWDTIISVKVPDAAAHIVAGMTGKATITAFESDKAITVPASALQRADDGSHFVHLKAGDGKPTKRPVTVGWRNGNKVQITKGIKAGDHVKVGDAKPEPKPEPTGKTAQDKK